MTSSPRTSLDDLAGLTRRSAVLITIEDIPDDLSRNEAEVAELAEIRHAWVEADAGDFASDDDVEALARKWR